MPRRPSQPPPWGYLLPMRPGAGVLELRVDEATVGADPACALQVGVEAFASRPAALPRLLFRVRRAAVTAGSVTSQAALRDESGLCWVEGVPALTRKRLTALPHGALVAVGPRAGASAPPPSWVFADAATAGNLEGATDEFRARYLVARPLGHGSFGHVHLVFNKKQFAPFALKVVAQNVFAKREAEILQPLSHPCVIHTDWIAWSPKHAFLVLEYMDGGDLSQFINERRLLNENQSKLLFFQLSLAVQYLHSKGICHRDLKPANILMARRDPHSLIKVTDFGLAKEENLHSRMTTLAGTELFLAPEVVKDQTYTKQVDIWSMGVILYYSLSGTVPFPHGMHEAMRMQYQVNYPMERWRNVTVTALDLVRRMMQANATTRATIDQVLDSQWFRDEKMRVAAFELTRIPSLRPPSSEVKRNGVGPPKKGATPAPPLRRESAAPRGLLEYLRTRPPGARKPEVHPATPPPKKEPAQRAAPQQVRKEAAVPKPSARVDPKKQIVTTKRDQAPARLVPQQPVQPRTAPVTPRVPVSPNRPARDQPQTHFHIHEVQRQTHQVKAQKTFLLEARGKLRTVPKTDE